MSVENQHASVTRALLDWYDTNARTLPWRSPPGSPPPDPYRVWLSEVMLQQTQVATVLPYHEAFLARWPTVEALAAADDAAVMAAWAGLGYYSRARNLLTCARAVVERGGFPRDEAGLRALPGVGAYTAAAVAAIAFGQRAVVVDGNVERVVARLFAVETALPAARPELRRLAATLLPDARHGDFAQAMMDLGATLCTPRAPRCKVCPLANECAALAAGEPSRYPVRAEKRARPERRATAWWIVEGDRVLLVQRPPRDLLGGMMALPSTLGAHDALAVDGVGIGSVMHVFTHFRLTLDVVTGQLEPGCNPPLGGKWWPLAELDAAGLPTLFAKAARLAITRGT